MRQDKPSREPTMKLPHVIVLSLIGMLTTSLSVLVFTSPRQPPQDTLTSNETDSSIIPSASPTPRLSLSVEPVLTVPSVSLSAPIAPIQRDSPTTPTAQRRRSVFETLGNNSPNLGKLQLVTASNPCMFFVDGEPVMLAKSVILPVFPGAYAVKCQHADRTIEQGANVVAGQTTLVSFE